MLPREAEEAALPGRRAARLVVAKVDHDQAEAARSQQQLGGATLARGPGDLPARGRLAAEADRASWSLVGRRCLGHVDDDEGADVDAEGLEVGRVELAADGLDPRGRLAFALGLGEDRDGRGGLGRAAQLGDPSGGDELGERLAWSGDVFEERIELERGHVCDPSVAER